ncbi:MAG: tetratricopeptide repeat protein [Betaproteobacteria bacterium]|nr:tetratricopeptide repeat protein [Betaproteobacteria bacterium]
MRAAICLTIGLLAVALAPLPMLSAHAAGDAPQAVEQPRDADYEAGKKAVAAGSWKIALEHFNRVALREPRNADVHNYLGYAWRKSGNLDLAFKHYGEALKLDPKHRGAHEYIGEAYLMANNLPKAEEHLRALDKLCFFSCEEYRDLKQAIENYRGAKK